MHGQIQDLLSSVLFYGLVILHRPYPLSFPFFPPFLYFVYLAVQFQLSVFLHND